MLCYKYSIRCWQPSLMLNHKVQTEEGKQKEIWQSNSQIIFMLPLNKLTNAATLQKKSRQLCKKRAGKEKQDRQTVEQTDRQTDSCRWSCCCCLVFKSTFMSTKLCTTSIYPDREEVPGGVAMCVCHCATVAANLQQTFHCCVSKRQAK